MTDGEYQTARRGDQGWRERAIPAVLASRSAFCPSLEGGQNIRKIRRHDRPEYRGIRTCDLRAINNLCAAGLKANELVVHEYARAIDYRLVEKALIRRTSRSVLMKASCPGGCMVNRVPLANGPWSSMRSIPAFQSPHLSTSASSSQRRAGRRSSQCCLRGST